MTRFLWVYAVIGTAYFFLSHSENEFFVKFIGRYAVGPFWLLMMAAPVILTLLLIFQFANRSREH